MSATSQGIDTLAKNKYFGLWFNAAMVGVSVWYFGWQIADLFFAIFLLTLIRVAFAVSLYRKNYDKNLIFFVFLMGKAYIPFLLAMGYAINTADSFFIDFRFGIAGLSGRFHFLFQDYGVVLLAYLLTEYLNYRRHQLPPPKEKMAEMQFLTRFYMNILYVGALVVGCAGLIYGGIMLGFFHAKFFLFMAVLFSVVVDLYAIKRGSLYDIRPERASTIGV